MKIPTEYLPYEKYIMYHTEKYIPTNTCGKDDIFITALLATQEAIEKFNPSKNKSLKNYINMCIHGRVVDFVFGGNFRKYNSSKQKKEKQLKEKLIENPYIIYQPIKDPLEILIEKEELKIKEEELIKRIDNIKRYKNLKGKVLAKNLVIDRVIHKLPYPQLMKKYGKSHKQIDNTLYRMIRFLKNNKGL